MKYLAEGLTLIIGSVIADYSELFILLCFLTFLEISAFLIKRSDTALFSSSSHLEHRDVAGGQLEGYRHLAAMRSKA